MLSNAYTWLIGIHSSTYLKSLPDFLTLLCLTLAFIAFFHIRKKPYFRLLCIFLAGFTWATLNAKLNLNWELPAHLEGKTLLAKGYVTSVPEWINQKAKFYFKLTELAGKPVKTSIQLTWYYPGRIQLYPGKKLQLLIRIKRPHSMMNPGGFDQEKFYFKAHIRAIGYVVKSPQNRSLNTDHFGQLINQCRYKFYEKIAALVSSENFIGIIIAMCLGIRQHITPEQWNTFQATGTSHLIAISGLHIGLAGGIFYVLTRLFWQYSTHLMQKMPTQQAASIGALIGGTFYACLAGLSIPTQRALIMMSTFILALLCRRYITPWHVFSLSLFLILTLDPLATLSESFWLSFGAIFFIFYSMTSRVSFGKSLWNRYGKVQWAITLGLTPITCLFFQQTALLSFPANLIAIPWVSFLVIPIALLGMALLWIFESPAHTLLLFSSKLLEYLYTFLHYISQQKYALWHQSIPENGYFIIVLAGILLMLSPKGLPGRWLGLFTFLPLFFYNQPRLPEKTIGLTLLDVGQGLSAIVQTRHHTLVFDTGAKFSNRLDMGKAAVIPYLQTQNIRNIDTLIVSHQDNDHMGGAHSILNTLRVQKILTSVPQHFPQSLTEACHRGQNWVWDGVIFQILYPIKGAPYVGNNSSCTLQIKLGKHAVLLTGDLEKKGESQLLKLDGNRLSSTLLIAGHHGSLTSSTWPFVQQVNPSYVLFSSGYLNPYRFPHPTVVSRFQKIGSRIENTAQSGGLYFEINEQDGIIKKIRFREKLKKYWHHR